MRHCLGLVALLALLALPACTAKPTHSHTPSDSGTDTAPVYTEGAGGMSFVDQTDAWGLSTAHGESLQVVDLDGDGFPDLVTQDNGGIDDFTDPSVERFHFVLMNRPNPSGTGRIFVDETEASGLYQRRTGDGGRPSTQHVFFDMDGDGDLDAFAGVFNDPHTDPATHWTDMSDVLLNDGTGHFSFAPVSPDLQVDFPMCGVTSNDFDGDGIVDLYLALWYQNIDLYNNATWLNWVYGADDRLLHGNGEGTFTDVSDASGVTIGESNSTRNVLHGLHARPSMGATSCDLDGDGFPEILAQAYGRQWNVQWKNDGSGHFTNVGKASGYEADGNIDYSDNWYYDCYCWTQGTCDAPTNPDFPYSKSQCQQVADGGYWNVGWDDQPANLNGNTFTSVCADLDNDGHMDVVNAEITHEWAGLSSDFSAILMNDGTGNFTRPDSTQNGFTRVGVLNPDNGSWDFGDQKAAVADLDNDGLQDILVSSGAGYYGNFLYVFRQWSPGQYAEVETDVGLNVPTSHGLAIADFDRDGDLDIVGDSLTELVGDSTTDHRLYFFENTSETRHWLRVALHSGVSNGVGVGAQVMVTAHAPGADAVTYTREVSGGYGQSGMQQDVVLAYGLGDADTIDAVSVRWVGGVTESFSGVEVDETVDLTAGGGVSPE